jgi:hypothetical protein
MLHTLRLALAASALLFAGSASPALADPPLPAGCTEDADPDCLYQLANPLFADNTLVELPLTLPDPTRNNFRVPMLIRFSTAELNEPAPIVIWNHGGAPRSTGRFANSEFGKLLASAGYVVIHPSRKPLASANGFRQTCIRNGVKGGSVATFNTNCRNFIGHAIYGPENIDFVMKPATLAFIEAAIVNAGFLGTLDSGNIGIAGHSAGTSIVLAKAGALRRFKDGGPVYNQKSSELKAFFAAAPFGPDNGGFYYSPAWNYGGFDGTRFGAIDTRPFLSITGVGDEGPNVGDTGEEVVSEARTFAYRQAKQGDKYLSWNVESAADHGTVALGNCAGGLALYCVAYGNLGIAFFDAYLKGHQAAVDWLQTDGHEIYVDGDIELHRR